MFFAMELQMSGVYFSFIARAFSSRPSALIRVRKIALQRAYEAPRRRFVANSASFTDNAIASASCKPFPSRIAAPSPVRLRPPHVRLPARPPERARHDAVVVLLAQAARVPPIHPLILHLVVQIVLLGLGSRKIFACSAKHDTCAKPAVPRHEHPRTRPSFVFQWRACVQM